MKKATEDVSEKKLLKKDCGLRHQDEADGNKCGEGTRAKKAEELSLKKRKAEANKRKNGSSHIYIHINARLIHIYVES